MEEKPDKVLFSIILPLMRVSLMRVLFCINFFTCQAKGNLPSSCKKKWRPAILTQIRTVLIQLNMFLAKLKLRQCSMGQLWTICQVSRCICAVDMWDFQMNDHILSTQQVTLIFVALRTYLAIHLTMQSCVINKQQLISNQL